MNQLANELNFLNNKLGFNEGISTFIWTLTCSTPVSDRHRTEGHMHVNTHRQCHCPSRSICPALSMSESSPVRLSAPPPHPRPAPASSSAHRYRPSHFLDDTRRSSHTMIPTLQSSQPWAIRHKVMVLKMVFNYLKIRLKKLEASHGK